MSLAARNALEVMLQTLGFAQAQQRGFAFAGEHGWDISSLPIISPKAYARRRDPTDLMMIHCTGVTKGFGVQEWGPTGTRLWKRHVEGTLRQLDKAQPWPVDWRAAKVLPEAFVEELEHHGMLNEPVAAIAHFVALCTRFRNDPYHDIGTQSGYVLKNRDHDQRTFHGNGDEDSGGNQGIGVGLDCSPSTDLGEFSIATFQATIRASHLRWLKRKQQRARELGEDQAQIFKIKVVAHAQSKYPGRANDPGGGKAQLWKRVVEPVVESTPGMVIDPEWHYGTGRPLPAWGRA